MSEKSQYLLLSPARACLGIKPPANSTQACFNDPFVNRVVQRVSQVVAQQKL